MNKINGKINQLTKITYILFIYMVGIILPFYYEDKYFNIIEAKANIFNMIMPIISILCILIIATKIINSQYKNNRTSIFYFFLIIFLIGIVISYIYTKNEYSLSGTKGWNVGVLQISSLILSILAFNNISIDKKFYLPILIASCIIYIIAILHSFEIDFLYMHNNILEVSYHKYLSTIGNINWFVGYLALTVPTYAGLFLLINDKKHECIFAVCSTLGIITISLLGSDGIFLGIGFLSFFCVPFIFKNKKSIRKFAILLFTFAIGLFVARQLNYCMDGYSGLLRSYRYILLTSLISITLFVISYIVKNDFLQKKYILIVILIELVLFCVALLFVNSVINTNDAEWGTGRIALWIDSLKIFINLPLLNKLFGVGIECLYLVYSPLNIKYNGIYTSAHSEWIQLLLTGGLLNVSIYLICWALIIYTCIKSFVDSNNYKTSISFGIICYLGQSIVNSATLCNISLLSFLIIYLLNNNKN